MSSDSEAKSFMWSLALLMTFVLGGVSAWKWYSAGVQQQVWARQGCNMTRWEVFMGAKPIDRALIPAGSKP